MDRKPKASAAVVSPSFQPLSEIVFHTEHALVAMAIPIKRFLIAGGDEERNLLVCLVIHAKVGFPPVGQADVVANRTTVLLKASASTLERCREYS
jgi:hypothetical protein